ncbi:MAG TPA: bifunctional riboflavin kinase/FAD synthetase [Candidatus Kapabacteria bacterium]|nr:bifunctional riboflavin kinase/FAD synthetase [Candidatus Kapabacteria bacterium]
MRIVRPDEQFTSGRSVVSVGTFDGVHRAHQEIVQIMQEEQKRVGGTTCVVTFDPHPQEVLHSRPHEVRLLTTIEERLALLERYGVEVAVVLRFSKEFSQTPPEVFIENIIVRQLGAAYFVVGHDHGFGKGRKGDIELLQSLGEKFNFGVRAVDALIIDSEPVSSTRIRLAIESGDIPEANKLLGREYELHATVAHGDERGRTIGFPTANLVPLSPRKLIPADGVYAVRVKVDGKRYNAMMNIGVRPTLTAGLQHTIEAHILGFDGMIYGEQAEVAFVQRIRSEKKFDSVEQLIVQLKQDRAECLNIFKNNL